MSIIKSLKFMFASKGWLSGFNRIHTVRKRFGITPANQINCLNKYAHILEKYDIKATFFIPAIILKKYHAQLKKLESDRIEWGIHGYRHIDLSVLNRVQLNTEISKAINIFDDYHIPFNGFRAPYLRAGDYLVEVLKESKRFLYDSSNSFLLNQINGLNNEYTQWASRFYDAESFLSESSIPSKKSGIWEFPVILPDDDILLDRLKLKPNQISLLWEEMFKVLKRDKRLFIMQLHPERIIELNEALARFIEYVKDASPGVRFATLGELAVQGDCREEARHIICITGDIDAMDIQDFITR